MNKPRVKVNSYTFDGHMTYEHSGKAPVYAPNSYGRPWSDQTGPVEDSWEADGELVRSAYELHAEDDDFSQAGTLVREVFDDAQRDRLVETVADHLSKGVVEPVLSRAFQYWKNIDETIGERIDLVAQEGYGVSEHGPTLLALSDSRKTVVVRPGLLPGPTRRLRLAGW